MTSQETHDDSMASQELPTSLSDWNEASDWRGLVQLNQTFLKVGQTPETDQEEVLSPPYTPDFGDKRLIPHLLGLHEYGLLGISSQGKWSPGSPAELSDSDWEERKKAEYLEFFIPYNEDSKKFLESLLNDSQLQGVAFDGEGNRLTGSCETEIEVAWSRVSNSPENLSTTAWECDAIIPATYDPEPHAGLIRIEAFRKAYPMFCAIATLDDDAELLERIEEHVKAAGIAKE